MRGGLEERSFGAPLISWRKGHSLRQPKFQNIPFLFAVSSAVLGSCDSDPTCRKSNSIRSDPSDYKRIKKSERLQAGGPWDPIQLIGSI